MKLPTELIKSAYSKAVGVGKKAPGVVGRGAKYLATPEGLQNLAFGSTIRDMGRTPMGAASGAVGTYFLAETLMGEEGSLYSSLPATRRARLDKQLERERAQILRTQAMRAEYERLQTDANRSAARLAAMAPDIYNSILAGRRLPKGAMVLGGQPRTDLLAELAMRMAKGEFQEPANPLDGLV